MGRRSWMKYFGLMAAFSGIAGRVFAWLGQVQDSNSPGGEDITAAEVTQLEPVINDALNQALMSAEVPIQAQVTLTYIGD